MRARGGKEKGEERERLVCAIAGWERARGVERTGWLCRADGSSHARWRPSCRRVQGRSCAAKQNGGKTRGGMVRSGRVRRLK